jgi:hypothetical protein
VSRLTSPHPVDIATAVAALGLAVVLAAVTVKLPPLIAIGGIGVFAVVAIMGIEVLIVLGYLGAVGLLPFVDPGIFVLPGVKGYAFFFLIALGGMIAAWFARTFSGRASYPLPVNAMSLGLLLLLSYVVLAALASSPNQVPALAVPFALLPLAGLGTILWLSHEDALEGLQRALPIIVAIVAAWAVAYVLGSAGCGPCRAWVGTGISNEGLIGPDSRLYTAGQNSFIGLFLVAVAYALARPGRIPVALVTLGGLAIALQASRAQYAAVLAGAAVLIVWKLGQLRIGGRIVLGATAVLALATLLTSPVGQRAFSAYEDLQAGKGTGTYRLELLSETAQYWTVFGQGFFPHTLDLGYDVDLGIPNTLLVLGYAGAAIQVGLISIGIWRGLANRTVVGASVAAILLAVLVARPSLPLLEYGHSAVTYGVTLGVAAVMAVGLARESPE